MLYYRRDLEIKLQLYNKVSGIMKINSGKLMLSDIETFFVVYFTISQ
jgi:hypothetical protein